MPSTQISEFVCTVCTGTCIYIFVCSHPYVSLCFLNLFIHFLEYVALYTYESPEPGDLAFTEGDTILVSQRGGEWWTGSTGDRSGHFPSNYVKPKEADVT